VSEEKQKYNYAIQTKGLTKRFGNHAAVNSIDLSVPRGSVFGFLGPNGSGKTTTIRVLLGLIEATEGEVNVLGQKMPQNLNSVLPKVGALVEGPAFYPYLSGEANLKRLDSADQFASSKTRRERVAKAIERVGLTHAAKKKVHAYSLGMKQRLGIANALLQPRDLLILDEPTNGLDPQGTREVRNLVRSLASTGTTIFVSSHLLAEIEQLCDYVAVMSAGQIVAQGKIESLRKQGQTRVLVRTPDIEEAKKVMVKLGLEPKKIKEKTTGTQLISPLTVKGLAPEEIVLALTKAKVRVRGFITEEPSLEERFVSLTGEGFDVVQ
jgi:ABC-type multidrug transport system ATPase subunit